jgi:hypothetical protein
MDESKKHNTHQARYVTANRARRKSRVAYELISSSPHGDHLLNGYRLRSIGRDAKDDAGEPILVLEDRHHKVNIRINESPELSNKIAEAAARQKPQLAYELVTSDEFVGFYRVRSILRLQDYKKNTFVFVD